ncbi:GNAT family N-acetyltransferase [Gammaproteobacteria bacterium AS21]
MFLMKVDKHTDIVFLHQSFAVKFHLLYQSHRRHVSKWFNKEVAANDVSSFVSLVNDALADYAKGKTLQCAIFYQHNIIGYIGLVKINNLLKKAELNYWISHQYLDRGITFACCQSMIEYAFSFLKLEKLEIAIDTNNIDSRKMCETLNFELEGILNRADNINGLVINHAQYGLLKIHKPIINQ